MFYPYQQLRDLAWVIGSPVLMDIPENFLSYEATCSEYTAMEPLLLQLAQDPSPLLSHLATVKRQTLGSYFEALAAFWLERRPHTSVLAANLQVRDESSTIGEIDFIIREGSRVVHLEAAVKFYLSSQNQPDWQAWLGPRAHDRLEVKMQALLEKQLPLPANVAARQMLAGMGITPEDSRLLLKGYFFTYYLYFLESSGVSPVQAHRAHNRGWWCRLNELPSVCEALGEGCLFAVLPKQRWLSPAYYDDLTGLYDRQAFLRYLSFMPEPTLLVVAVSPREKGDGWDERYRGFVVPNRWPER